MRGPVGIGSKKKKKRGKWKWKRLDGAKEGVAKSYHWDVKKRRRDNTKVGDKESFSFPSRLRLSFVGNSLGDKQFICCCCCSVREQQLHSVSFCLIQYPLTCQQRGLIEREATLDGTGRRHPGGPFHQTAAAVNRSLFIFPHCLRQKASDAVAAPSGHWRCTSRREGKRHLSQHDGWQVVPHLCCSCWPPHPFFQLFWHSVCVCVCSI